MKNLLLKPTNSNLASTIDKKLCSKVTTLGPPCSGTQELHIQPSYNLHGLSLCIHSCALLYHRFTCDVPSTKPPPPHSYHGWCSTGKQLPRVVLSFHFTMVLCRPFKVSRIFLWCSSLSCLSGLQTLLPWAQLFTAAETR